ncbi:MAG TPA: LamG domain-containing protein [Candidatus Saccharimonadia bacterium]|nr:LamG domain-containing protein [Candidatus Saccharimonadia bacterium]
MSYVSEQNTDSPIDRWKFEETSGTAINDDIAATHNGTLNGGVTLNQTAPFMGAGLGAKFNGTSGYISFTNASGLLGIGTIEAVVQFTAISASTNTIFAHAFNGSSNPIPFVLGTNIDGNQSGKLQVGYYTGNVWQAVTWSTPPSLNTPYHIVGTYNGTALTLYVNGTQVATSNPASARPGAGSVNNTAYIGRQWFSAEYHNGYIWDVALYSSALSSGRVTAHYDALNSPFTDNFANASDLGTGGSNVSAIVTTGWTTEASEPGGMSHTGWATYTPAATASYRLSTNGSDFSTMLAMYTGTTLVNLVSVGAATGTLTVTLTASTTYYVQIGAQPAGSGGNLFFNLGPTSTSNLDQVYAEAMTQAAAIPRSLSQMYVEAMTTPAAPPRNVSQVYVETIVSNAPAPQLFIGWGIPI